MANKKRMVPFNRSLSLYDNMSVGELLDQLAGLTKKSLFCYELDYDPYGGSPDVRFYVTDYREETDKERVKRLDRNRRERVLRKERQIADEERERALLAQLKEKYES